MQSSTHFYITVCLSKLHSSLQLRAATKVSVDVEVQPPLLNIELGWFFWFPAYF